MFNGSTFTTDLVIKISLTWEVLHNMAAPPPCSLFLTHLFQMYLLLTERMLTVSSTCSELLWINSSLNYPLLKCSPWIHLSLIEVLSIFHDHPSSFQRLPTPSRVQTKLLRMDEAFSYLAQRCIYLRATPPLEPNKRDPALATFFRAILSLFLLYHTPWDKAKEVCPPPQTSVHPILPF